MMGCSVPIVVFEAFQMRKCKDMTSEFKELYWRDRRKLK